MYLYSVSAMVTGAVRKCSLLLHTNKKTVDHSKKKQKNKVFSFAPLARSMHTGPQRLGTRILPAGHNQ